ncbi:hypothetical protein [Actinoplanes utahensis]|uniref:NadR/Ttd14 AAA domain-containing protein n=1 Tax=Actinoplanes utahensis TaxID=1869 RepID=A0A0A6UCQ9_ACTUT|nr:hypothetical protein [Actinoplanes utahensis]KHD72079.1 hypothetical protein MB27_42310 [Actinoplanes utahensis]GIF28822.1 hypothetical protein Aut01nite_18080 [Actinoplanes utahensis]
MTVRAVALEGLPGAGKTTLLTRLARALPDVRVLPELVLPPESPGDEAFFVRNDLEKARLAQLAGRALLDRAWPSTAAYVLAEERWSGRAAGPEEVIERLYGAPPQVPTAYVMLDPVRVVTRAYVTAVLFWNARFRRELRRAYHDVFAVAGMPVLVIDDRPDRRLLPFVTDQLAVQATPASAGGTG